MQALPLRSTRSFLQHSIERLGRSSPAFKVAHALWQDGFTNILADLLKLLRFVIGEVLQK